MQQLKNLMPLEMSAQSCEHAKLTEEEKCIQRCEAMNNSRGYKNENDGYDCQKCDNRGGFYKPVYMNGCWYEVMQQCECETIRKTIRRLSKSGLKDIVKRYTFKSYEAIEQWQQTIKATAAKYCENSEGKWFFIGGQSGAGKTHICTAIAFYLIKKGFSARYMLWREDIVPLKAAVTNSMEYKAMIADFKETQVLYIDDLFKTGKGADGKLQQPTVADINIAFEILNYRYNKKLRTIISSECTLADILAIDEAVGGRIAELAVQQGYGISIKPNKDRNYRLKQVCEV